MLAAAGYANVSVVVCAYTENRMDLLTDCLDAVLEQLGAGDGLVVVIDYNEALFGAIDARYGGRAAVLRNAGPRGLSGARNTGVKTATGDVVAFVDDDAQIQHGWVQRLREHYGDPSVAGVGGYATPVWPAARPGWFPTEFDWVVGCSHRGLPTEVAPVRNFIGCNMSFRRTVFADVGDFNTDVGRVGTRPVGCEETEFCIRVSQHTPGARLVFDPALRVRHWVTSERARPSYLVNRCFSEGLSKYTVSTTVGSSEALSSERRYVTRVLPMGFAIGLRDAVIGRGSRSMALARAMTIVLGLGVTVVGYGYSMVRTRLAATR